jgi:hypothetical protein
LREEGERIFRTTWAREKSVACCERGCHFCLKVEELVI